jgi:hypothetical protein
MGAIAITEQHGWVGAAWVLRAIARSLERHGDFPSLADQFTAVEEGWQFLDLSELTELEKLELYRVMPSIVEEVRKAGPAMLTNAEFYPGFLAAYEELEQLVRAAFSTR